MAVLDKVYVAVGAASAVAFYGYIASCYRRQDLEAEWRAVYDEGSIIKKIDRIQNPEVRERLSYEYREITNRRFSSPLTNKDLKQLTFRLKKVRDEAFAESWCQYQ